MAESRIEMERRMERKRSEQLAASNRGEARWLAAGV